MKNNITDTRKAATIALMLAIAVVFSFIPSVPVLPSVNFIRYEFSDLPILISVFAFGTPVGVVIAALSILINFLFGGAESGPYGMIMHFIAIGAYATAAGITYKLRKTRNGAITGLFLGVIVMTLVMIPANLFITPAFMGVPIDVVKPLIFTAIIPVNLIKGLITAVLTFVLYKRISNLLHGR